MADKLTAKQQTFINAYLANGFNATQAAIEAGYSEKTAHAIGWENLRKPEIKAAIDEALASFAMPKSEVLARLADHARGDMRDFAGLTLESLGTHPRGNLIKKLKLDVKYDSQNKAHSFIDTFELYDAQAALIQLARVHGLLTDKSEVKVNDWRSQAIDDIKAGNVTYEALVSHFDNEIATELFRAAGLPIPPTEG